MAEGSYTREHYIKRLNTNKPRASQQCATSMAYEEELLLVSLLQDAQDLHYNTHTLRTATALQAQ
jgi:hypothetical protein